MRGERRAGPLRPRTRPEELKALEVKTTTEVFSRTAYILVLAVVNTESCPVRSTISISGLLSRAPTKKTLQKGKRALLSVHSDTALNTKK